MKRIGIVYYADDPNRTIFRTVFLTGDDPESMLDDPKWVTEGCDSDRVVRLIKLESLEDIPSGFTRTIPDAADDAAPGELFDVESGAPTIHGPKAGARYDPQNDLPLPVPDTINPADVIEAP